VGEPAAQIGQYRQREPLGHGRLGDHRTLQTGERGGQVAGGRYRRVGEDGAADLPAVAGHQRFRPVDGVAGKADGVEPRARALVGIAQQPDPRPSPVDHSLGGRRQQHLGRRRPGQVEHVQSGRGGKPR